MTRRIVQQVVRVGAAVLASTTLLLAGSVYARTIRVDVGSLNYDTTGQAWEDTETELGALSVLPGTLPFGIDYGTGIQTGFCLGENGTVGFADDCGAVPADSLLSVLAGSWVADPAATRIFEFGSVTYTEGRLAANSPFPADPNDAPRAVRFHWNEVCTIAPCPPDPTSPDPNPTWTFQAILIDVGNGNGDFDLELNYGGPIPAGTGAISFVLGDNVFTFPGDVANEQSFDFRFRNGVLVDGSAVPEPPTLLIAALALLLFAAGRRRIRVR